MDKLVDYRNLIKRSLSKYAELANRPPTDSLETHIIFDEERDRYLLLRTGWWGKKRIRSVVVYARLYEGKIWIEEDWAEDGVATELMAAGVPKDDIVLAFRHPEMQPLEALDAAGYARIPAQLEETEVWLPEQDWGDEWDVGKAG
ncbi:MAG: XisI protein [Chloroflexi bacterium]|nr:XisI protein [Chloroflexota bacterium]MCI0649840.1 XisI protein [Chloroflexota bacterium]MCI0725121.1 XisI protein [Chloroflexota bacterium]